MEEEIKRIIKNWDIGDLINYKQAKKGVVNINYIIKTSKGKYVLRKVKLEKSRKQIEFELNYLDYLKNKGFSYRIPAPIKTITNKFYIIIGKDIFWLYEYIEGGHVSRFNKPELKEIAKMMAEYHSIIEKSNLDNKSKYSPFAKEEIFREIKGFRKNILKKQKRNKIKKLFLEKSGKLINLFNELNTKKYSQIIKYPLHRDINPENTLWKGKKLIGVIDFENVSEIKETLVKDIAGMLQYSCRDKKFKYKTDLDLMRFFIKEYTKYHKLSKEDIKLIPEIIIAGAIEDFSYSYWMILNDPKRAKAYRLKLYSKVAEWHYKNKNKIIKKIITWN